MKNGYFGFAALLFSYSAFADLPAAPSPDCAGALAVNNAQVLQWKNTTQNEYHDRGHVSGTVGRVYPDQTGHHHFQLQIGSGASDTVEIVYNEDFATTPDIRGGMNVEACGDYITANSSSGGYPPSPDGALLHWVHRSNSPKHPSGYLVIDGKLYN
jgi:hypothetical protein